jgi:predicted DNA-binding protein YlxM (UPF0122 family)
MSEPSIEPNIYFDEQQPVNAVATMLNAAMVRIVEAADYSPLRIAVIVARAGNMSYSEIGKRFGISKQAVEKHIRAVTKVNSDLGKLLSSKMPSIHETTPIRDQLLTENIPAKSYLEKQKEILCQFKTNK